mmetsp:Transcript_72571/g.189287  ORF Transcript_72571/g.189287 Transcript_72571/m.189287 type:complete len:200 (+) Transcript_72571:139-738(+)
MYAPTAAALLSALLVALPPAAASSCGGPGEPCEKSAARPPASAGNAFYQSSMVVGKIAGAAVEEEDLRYLQHGSLPGLDELDDEFGAGLAAPLQAEERPYRSSLPGLDELDDEFGFGAEVPPADPAASPPFSGYGAGDPSAQWAVPPQAIVNLFLAIAEIAIVVGAVAALLLRRRALRREEPLKGRVSGPPSKRLVVRA